MAALSLLQRNAVKLIFLVVALATCSGILWRPVIEGNGAGNRCLAMYLLVLLFYIGNVMPYHAISMLIPVLAVLFRVMRGGGRGESILPPGLAAAQIVGSMLDSIALIVLGSFCLAVALRKYRIAKALGLDWIVRAIPNPSLLSLATMYLVLGGSYLLGSSPSTFLVAAVILDLLQEGAEPPPSPNIHKGLLMGLVSAGTIGSMASPISSPHSNFAYYNIHSVVNGLWWPWLVASLPTTVLATGLAWAINSFIYGLFDAPRNHRNPSQLEGIILRRVSEAGTIPKEAGQISEASREERFFLVKQLYVAVVALGTFGCLLLSPHLRTWIGNMGIISLFPIIALFGAGLLEKRHLHLLRWDILMMCLGGVALNEAVRSSGLIDTFTKHTLTIMRYGNAYARMVILGGLITVSAILKSRFVTAFVILPVISETVQRAVGPAQQYERMALYMTCTFACSAGQALATSGIISTALAGSTDLKGRPYLDQLDFVRVGIPTSLVTFLCIITVAFLTMTMVWPILFPSFLID